MLKRKTGNLVGVLVASSLFLFSGCSQLQSAFGMGGDKESECTSQTCNTKSCDSGCQSVPTNTKGCVSNTKSCNSKPVCTTCTPSCADKNPPSNATVLKKAKKLHVSVVGEGVAPCNGSCSPAQAYAMAKRAAIVDGYRLLAEKINGVYVEGNDYVKNMAIKRSIIRTRVNALINNANIVETKFKDGLCEVQMEVVLRYSDLAL